MSITYKFYCIESTMKKVSALDKRFATFRVTEIPNVKITSATCGSNGHIMNYNDNTLYQKTANITGVCGTIYYIVLRIDLCKISAKEMRMLYSIINEGVYRFYYYRDNTWMSGSYTPILTLPKNNYSAVYFKIARAHEKIAHHDRDLISGNRYAYTLDDSLTSSTNICYSDSNAQIKENYPVYAYRNSPSDFPIVTYTFILLDPYNQKCIEHLKKIYAELTNDAPLIGWNDETMEYIYRTEDTSPFINKKELEKLIYKLEHDEDIPPRKQSITPLEEIDPPSPVKRSSNKCAIRSKITETIKETTSYVNPRKDLHESSSSDEEIIKVPGWESSSEEEEYSEEASEEEISEEEIADENASADSCSIVSLSIVSDHEPVKVFAPKHKPKRVRLRESLSQETIKDTPNEIIDRVDTYENSHESSPAPKEIKVKHAAGYDRAVSDHEPVKALKLSYTAENINIFLVIYAVIMTALVTIGMASR